MHRPDPLPARAAQLKGEGSGNETSLRRQKCTAIICRDRASVRSREFGSVRSSFKCISIMRDSNGGSATVRSRGGVLSREGSFSEVPLYLVKIRQYAEPSHRQTAAEHKAAG